VKQAPVVKQAKKVTFEEEPLVWETNAKQTPVEPVAPVRGGVVDLDDKRLQDNLAVRKRIAALEPTPVVLTQEETVIRVPKELVIQAMELAMKSGKINIRVEII
jgi:hypothetical protein